MKRPSKQDNRRAYLHIVDKESDYIVVSGFKMSITQAAYADEILVLPTRALTEDDRDFAVAFAVPADIDGLSLITRPVDDKKLETYYALTRTPVVQGEKVEEPCTFPRDAVTLPRRKLLPFNSLEINMPSGQMVAGFAAGWLGVAVLIAVFLWLIS